MEKKGARLFQANEETFDYGWNIVELETRRQLRLKVNELLRLVNDPTLTTSEMQQHLLCNKERFGKQLARQLVRSLHRGDQRERQSIVWLLTLLNEADAVTPLRHMSGNKQLPRPVRLSASLALAGMGATPEMLDERRQARLYAIG
ncbi:MAG TPA: hypothetical protein VFQ36_14680 [Ktedonobacteraceae bacterium]|nr:hypothetical protein [Ktedonobacteraceae bacterium]